MATDELDSILDSLHEMQLSLDECLQQRGPPQMTPKNPKVVTADVPAPAAATAAKTVSEAKLVAAVVIEAPATAAAVADSDGSPDDFPPPPPPEELVAQLSPMCLSADNTASSICEVASNDSGIQDSPLAGRRTIEGKPGTTASAITTTTTTTEDAAAAAAAAAATAKSSTAATAAGRVGQRVTWSIQAAAATDQDVRVKRPTSQPSQDSDGGSGGGGGGGSGGGACATTQAEAEAPPPPQPLAVQEVAGAAAEPPVSKPETKQERKAREAREKLARKELERQQKEAAKQLRKSGGSVKKVQPQPATASAAVVLDGPTSAPADEGDKATPTSSAPLPTASESPTKVLTTELGGEASLPSLMSVTRPAMQQQQQQQQQSEQSQATLQRQASATAGAACETMAANPAPVSFFMASMQERIRVMDELFNKANLTRMAVRIHCLDRTTKMLALDERSKTGLMCTLMANKNLTERRLNHSIVEKLPEMKMERIIEDHELLGDSLLAWPTNSKNLLFFEEREEKYGALTNPDVYLGDSFAREHGETAQQQLNRVINDLFEGEGSVPTIKEYLHVRQAGTKVWKKRVCILRSSGIYAAKKGKTELKCITSLSGFYLFTTLGGWTSKGKIEAPTPHGFALKALQTHSLQSKQLHFFSATSEAAMKRWCTAIRIAMIGNQYYLSYQFAHKSSNAK